MIIIEFIINVHQSSLNSSINSIGRVPGIPSSWRLGTEHSGVTEHGNEFVYEDAVAGEGATRHPKTVFIIISSHGVQ